RRLPPGTGFVVRLAGGAVGGRQVDDFEPRVIGQELDEALPDRARRPQHANGDLRHAIILSDAQVESRRRAVSWTWWTARPWKSARTAFSRPTACAARPAPPAPTQTPPTRC